MFGFHRAFVKKLAAAPGRVNCDFNHTRVRLCGAQQDQTKHACFGKDRTAVRPVETRVTVLLREKRGSNTFCKGTATNRGAGSDQEATPCLKQPPALMLYPTYLAIP
jgi:hypothetical protein